MTSLIRTLLLDPGCRVSGLASELLNCSVVAFVCAAATPPGAPAAPLPQTALVQPALPSALTAEPETLAVRLRSETPGPVPSQEEGPPAPRGAEPEDTAAPTLAAAAPTPEPDMDEVNQYLWAVYRRSPVKRDGSGDFTWKDSAAAAHAGMSLGDYVIRGMDGDFRELLYRAGLGMDAAGFRWTILSGFRDDYRQALASGFRAAITDSLHGGSATTGGYGHGCAVDIRDENGNSRGLWVWLDAHKAELGLERPLPGLDPAHVQPRGPWQETGAALRKDRLGKGTPSEGAPAVAPPPDLSSTPPSEEDMRCIGLHHHPDEPAPAIASAPGEAQSLQPRFQAHGPGEMPKGRQKAGPKQTQRLAVQGPASEGSKPAGRNKLIAPTSAKLPPNKASARPLARHMPHPASNAGRT